MNDASTARPTDSQLSVAQQSSVYERRKSHGASSLRVQFLTHGLNMIKHIVMWNVRGETPEQKQQTAEMVKNAFESLGGKIPGMTRLEVGMDVSRVDYACDVVLYTEFENEEFLQAYASHPNTFECDKRSETFESRVTKSIMFEHASNPFHEDHPHV